METQTVNGQAALLYGEVCYKEGAKSVRRTPAYYQHWSVDAGGYIKLEMPSGMTHADVDEFEELLTLVIRQHRRWATTPARKRIMTSADLGIAPAP